ncbi:Protein of unknown function [Cotesia congregata]|uniref:Uncharacterized protein n=1 Tax=Cotesia congregata TaxID=51543 RepID=A0A8J2HJD3_COTCN|nr:Protein of unknown function [Cotesia congregata]
MESEQSAFFDAESNFCSECGSILPLLREFNCVVCYICKREWGPENSKKRKIHEKTVDPKGHPCNFPLIPYLSAQNFTYYAFELSELQNLLEVS